MADQATQSGVCSELGSPTGRSIFNEDAEDVTVMGFATLLRDANQQWLHKSRLAVNKRRRWILEHENTAYIFYRDAWTCKISSWRKVHSRMNVIAIFFLWSYFYPRIKYDILLALYILFY